MSDAKDKSEKTVEVPAERQRQDETGREDPSEPADVGSAKETTTVRGTDTPQAVRGSVRR